MSTKDEEVIDIIEETTAVVEKKETDVAVAENKSALLSVNPFESKQSFNDYFNMGKYLATSDLAPDGYKNKPMNCVIALEQANRMGVSPLFIMQNLYIIKGKPSWSGQACAMLVNGCGQFENVKLNYVGEKGTDNYGAFVSATRKEDGEEVVGTTVDMKMVKAFGWSNNPMWKSMPEQMMGYRAYSMFARLHCPNALNGFATEGEVEDMNSGKHEVDEVF